jgi:hypothetical protein
MLPTHGGTKRNNGLAGIPVVNKQVLLTIAWLLASIFTIFYGFYHCRANGYSYALRCDATMCKYTTINVDNVKNYEWERDDFLNVYQGKVLREGEEVLDAEAQRASSVSEKRRRRRQKGGMTLQLEFQVAAEQGSRIKVINKIPFTLHDIGRRAVRNNEKAIKKYRDGDTDSVSISSVKRVTLLGVLTIIGGILSVLMSLLLGVWSDPTPRRMKKAA